jgi:hypothetical protein
LDLPFWVLFAFFRQCPRETNKEEDLISDISYILCVTVEMRVKMCGNCGRLLMFYNGSQYGYSSSSFEEKEG